MEDVEPAHLEVARDDVADRVVAHVAHVDVAGWIREHLEDVLLRSRGVLARPVQAGFLPPGLPALFYLLGLVPVTCQVPLLVGELEYRQ
jgi:hypothetical protein